MPLKTIKYSQRLGDIVRCLPAAKYLSEKGHEVFFDCLAQYQGIFEMTSYVKAGHRQGDILDLEVWPDRYESYRNSNMTWTDFVYSHPEIEKADKKNIVLDLLDESPAEGLPKEYNLVAPFGISQGHKRDPLQIIVEARKKLGGENFFVLCPPGVQISGLVTFTASSIPQLARAIRGAKEFWSIDSGQMALAAGVRKDKKVVYFPQTMEPWNNDNIFLWDSVELG